MLFYHYSKQKHTSLKCSRLTHEIGHEAMEKAKAAQVRNNLPGTYYDHISLFLDPIPEKRIAALFGHKHEFWKSGNKLYMHILDSTDFPSEMGFEIVETPEMDNWSDQFDWYHMDKYQREIAMSAFYKEMHARGFMGRGTEKMIAKCRKYIGKTERYYELARQREDAADTISKYAANVPHVMVYPPSGELTVREVGIIVIS